MAIPLKYIIISTLVLNFVLQRYDLSGPWDRLLAASPDPISYLLGHLGTAVHDLYVALNSEWSYFLTFILPMWTAAIRKFSIYLRALVPAPVFMVGETFFILSGSEALVHFVTLLLYRHASDRHDEFTLLVNRILIVLYISGHIRVFFNVMGIFELYTEYVINRVFRLADER